MYYYLLVKTENFQFFGYFVQHIITETITVIKSYLP